MILAVVVVHVNVVVFVAVMLGAVVFCAMATTADAVQLLTGSVTVKV